MTTRERFGLSAALTTPFDAHGAIDVSKMVAHARHLLTSGCDSVTLFGTTGEGTSISRDERAMVMAAMTAGGVPAGKIVCGIGETSVAGAAEMARIALEFGARNVLMLPPFYIKNPSDDGVYAWFAAVFAALGSTARDVILYHIPSLTEVPFSLELIQRLAADFPDIVYGVKDSGCEWTFTEALLAKRGKLSIMVGDERDLARAVRMGSAGAISGMANVAPGRIRGLAVDGRDDPAVVEMVTALVTNPVTPAVKAMVAHVSGDAGWKRTRPPLEPTPAAAAEALAVLHDRVFAVA